MTRHDATRCSLHPAQPTSPCNRACSEAALSLHPRHFWNFGLKIRLVYKCSLSTLHFRRPFGGIKWEWRGGLPRLQVSYFPLIHSRCPLVVNVLIFLYFCFRFFSVFFSRLSFIFLLSIFILYQFPCSYLLSVPTSLYPFLCPVVSPIGVVEEGVFILFSLGSNSVLRNRYLSPLRFSFLFLTVLLIFTLWLNFVWWFSRFTSVLFCFLIAKGKLLKAPPIH